MSRRGWILFLTMGVLWGIPYLFIKVAVEELSPALIVVARTAIGTAVLLPIAAARGWLRPALARWRLLVVFAAIEVGVPWLALNSAEQHVTSSLAGLLIATTPIAAVLLGMALKHGEPLDAARLLGMGVGIAGVAALVGLDLGGEVTAGLQLGVVVVCYATGAFIIDRYLQDLPTLGVMALTFLLVTVAYLPFVPSQWPDHAPSTKAVLSVVALGLLCTVAAFLVFFRLIAEVGASRATVITFVNPAVAVVLGILLLDEPFTAGVAVGFPLVLLGCWLATRRTRTAAPLVAEP